MGAILGGIVKTILSPVVKLIFMGFYSLLIKGPLWLLNLENSVLNLATSDYTTKLLFNTSITDGKPHLNFFTSNSPLQPFYMTMIGVAGTLVTVFLGFVLLGSLNSKKGEPKVIKKLTHLSLSSAAVFTMPVAFLTVVSLTGALLTALNGQAKNLNNEDISKYKTYLTNKIVNFRNGNYDALAFNKTKQSDWSGELWSSDSTPIKPWTDGVTNQNFTKSINEIYDYLISSGPNPEFGTIPDDIKQLASIAKDNYKTLNDMVVTNNNGITTLKPNLLQKVNSAESIISKITPNYKNEDEADQIKLLMDDLINIQDAIGNWQESMLSLFSYLPSNINSPPMAALANLKTVYEKIWDSNSNNQVITTLSDFYNSIGHIVNGDPKTGLGGLIGLKTQISSFEDSSLTVVFYQLVTGNKDTNWDRSFSKLENGGAMLLIGAVMIGAAIMMLATIILECFMRTLMLGLLFITGPIWIGTSVVDNSARLKTWINVCVGQAISIFGVILILRFGFVLLDKFQDLLDNSQSKLFNGNQGFLVRSLTLAAFAYAIMQGAIKSREILLQIAGSNQGLMKSARNGAGIKKIWSAGKIAASGGVAALGMKMVSNAAGNIKSAGGGLGGGSSSVGRSSSGRIASFKQNWTRRANAIRKPINTLSDATTKVTRGKFGTMAGKTNYSDQLQSKVASKILKNYNKSPLVKAGKKADVKKSIKNLKKYKKSLKGGD